MSSELVNSINSFQKEEANVLRQIANCRNEINNDKDVGWNEEEISRLRQNLQAETKHLVKMLLMQVQHMIDSM